MSKPVIVKNLVMGGGSPVLIQSMTNTPTTDTRATLAQIRKLAKAGCDIVRIALPDAESAEAVKEIVKGSPLPVVGDVQFDHRIAVRAIENGVHKIRLNPGNIGAERNVEYLADCAREHKVPIRIGVNGGSIEKAILRSNISRSEMLCASALRNIRLLEKYSFTDIVVSVKSSDVKNTIEAYEMLDHAVSYPLHLGVTEAGLYDAALLKSAIAIGSLLVKGIGDTLRVSVTGDPVKEVQAAREIMKAAGVLPHVEIISCPTCARCEYDLESLAKYVYDLTKDVNKNLKVAVMGCPVNGPGEAKDADIGIAGSRDKFTVFQSGRVTISADRETAVAIFKDELQKLL